MQPSIYSLFPSFVTPPSSFSAPSSSPSSSRTIDFCNRIACFSPSISSHSIQYWQSHNGKIISPEQVAKQLHDQNETSSTTISKTKPTKVDYYLSDNSKTCPHTIEWQVKYDHLVIRSSWLDACTESGKIQSIYQYLLPLASFQPNGLHYQSCSHEKVCLCLINENKSPFLSTANHPSSRSSDQNLSSSTTTSTQSEQETEQKSYSSSNIREKESESRRDARGQQRKAAKRQRSPSISPARDYHPRRPHEQQQTRILSERRVEGNRVGVPTNSTKKMSKHKQAVAESPHRTGVEGRIERGNQPRRKEDQEEQREVRPQPSRTRERRLVNSSLTGDDSALMWPGLVVPL